MQVKRGATYNVIAESGVYTATIRVLTDDDANLVDRLSTIAKVEEIPQAKFAYWS